MHNRAAVIKRLGAFVALCVFMRSQNKQLSVCAPVPDFVVYRGSLPAPSLACVGFTGRTINAHTQRRRPRHLLRGG